MNRAKGIMPWPSACARNTARNSGEAAAVGSGDERIYKPEPMPTVARMFKRILIVAAGTALGLMIAAAGLRSRMLLQIHDELVFETPAEEQGVLQAMVREEMTTALQKELRVPLRVDMNIGPNWHDQVEVG